MTDKELSFFQCGDCNTRLFCGYVCHKCGSDNAKDCDEAVQQVQPENDDLTAAYLAGYHKGKEVQPVQPKRELLTDSQVNEITEACWNAPGYLGTQQLLRRVARAIEAAIAQPVQPTRPLTSKE